MSTWDGVKESIQRAMAQLAPEVTELSQRIYEHPELSHEERLASSWCAEALTDHGFEVDWVDGMETAFIATLRGSDPGPTVGLLAEYDALPGIGHGCGHNLIAGSAVGAGMALASRAVDLPGTIQVFGCPAEEVGEGKPAMLEAGAFDHTDVAITFHAWHTTALMTECNGLKTLEFTFHGEPAHAASEPWSGVSALDGVLLTYQNLNALRQFLRDGTRVHGIITHGGDSHNIVPERAACRISARASQPRVLDRIVDRVIDCADAGALASGAELQIRHLATMDPVRFNQPLGRLHASNLDELGESVGEWKASASTDFGNVSQQLPALLFSVAAWPASTTFHTHEAAAAAGQSQAYEAMLKGASSMAMSAVDLLTQPGTLESIREAHERTQ